MVELLAGLFVLTILGLSLRTSAHAFQRGRYAMSTRHLYLSEYRRLYTGRRAQRIGAFLVVCSIVFGAAAGVCIAIILVKMTRALI